MNDAAVRSIAQSDPVPNLSASWGERAAEARKAVATLELRLRDLDHIQGQLADRGLTVSTDLGPIGNAAAAARRDLERDNGRTFQLPR